jgi:hypothetical protein
MAAAEFGRLIEAEHGTAMALGQELGF